MGQSGLLSKKREKVFVMTSLIPIIFLFSVFSFLPILFSIIISLFNYHPLSNNWPFVGLNNYTSLLRDKIFFQVLGNTFYYVGFAASLNIFLATIVGLSLFSLKNSTFRNFSRFIFYLPTLTPIVGAALVFRSILDPYTGIIRMISRILGHELIISWTADPNLVIPGIVIMTVWRDLGYNIILVMAGLLSIPGCMFEAARIDGASPFKIFYRITLPLLSKTMLFITIMTLLEYFQVFAHMKVFSNGGPANASTTLGLLIYKNAFQYSRMGAATAQAIVLLLIMLIISYIQIKTNEGEWEYV